MRCDMHVHTRYSGAVGLPLLRHVGRESYSEPLEVYWTALRRGMDLVTITDHDTIDGALTIVHLPHFFVSEEVTCHLPGGRRLHLGVFGLDERQHERIQATSRDAEALFAYLAEQALPFCLNHPFSPLTGRRETGDLHMGFGRAHAVEVINGMMPPNSNAAARAAARVAGLPGVGGSDAHAMGSVARSFTEVEGARNREEFLEGLRRGRTVPRGTSGSYARLVRDIFTVFTGAVCENASLASRSAHDLRRFAGAVALMPVLLLLPAIAAVSYGRERFIADVHHRRYRASMGHGHALPMPVDAVDAAEVA